MAELNIFWKKQTPFKCVSLAFDHAFVSESKSVEKEARGRGRIKYVLEKADALQMRQYRILSCFCFRVKVC